MVLRDRHQEYDEADRQRVLEMRSRLGRSSWCGSSRLCTAVLREDIDPFLTKVDAKTDSGREGTYFLVLLRQIT